MSDHSSHSDHTAHSGHSSQGHDHHVPEIPATAKHPTSMMHTSFHFGTHEELLFDWWTTDGVWGMLASCVVVFLMAFSYEALKFLRARLLLRSRQTRYSSVGRMDGVTGESASTPETESVVTMTSSHHLQQTALYVVQLTLGYLLMLLFMCFNVWICLALVLGASTGYFLFGWHTSPALISAGDHCSA